MFGRRFDSAHLHNINYVSINYIIYAQTLVVCAYFLLLKFIILKAVVMWLWVRGKTLCIE